MGERELIENDMSAFLKQDATKELLRFVSVGSVDDGKSTLIGRLLHDSKGVYDDQLADAVRTSATGEKAVDFALLTDGLRAEREQGITIDVAYRYFSTPKRKFIIADTPGHVQYTRNMATGASTAGAALILIDARHGVLQQSRRHAYIASLLGIPHLLVCVNKMDLVDYDKDTYEAITEDFMGFVNNLGFGSGVARRVRGARQASAFASVTTVPISALEGTNVVGPSELTPWYDGPSVLDFLESVPVDAHANARDFRFPVQYVLRPNLDYRGYAGQVVSGSVKVGDEVRVLPSGKTSRVSGIDTYDGGLEAARAPQSVVLLLEDEIDISRGDTIVPREELPFVGRSIDTMVVWMAETELDPSRSYMLKMGTRYVRTNVDEVAWRIDLDTLDTDASINELGLNDIGLVRLTTHRPVVFDPYKRNRHTGAFIIIDSMTNNTVGAGMILDPTRTSGVNTALNLGLKSQVSPTERRRRLQQRGAVVWLTGGDDDRRASLAYALERRLFDLGYYAVVADGRGPEDASALLSAPSRAADFARSLVNANLVGIWAVPDPIAGEAADVSSWVGEDAFFSVDIHRPDRAQYHCDVRVAEEDDFVAVRQIISEMRRRGHLVAP